MRPRSPLYSPLLRIGKNTFFTPLPLFPELLAPISFTKELRNRFVTLQDKPYLPFGSFPCVFSRRKRTPRFQPKDESLATSLTPLPRPRPVNALLSRFLSSLPRLQFTDYGLVSHEQGPSGFFFRIPSCAVPFTSPVPAHAFFIL